jgi:dTDP-4-amino-4,6-dideoxygalactose transaminase
MAAERPAPRGGADAVSAAPIPISRPYVADEEMAAVQEPLRSGWVAQGPRVAEFERRFAQFTGVEHAVATTSCTTALHIAVAALGAGPGDEVIVPAFTWVSTANVVEYVGATPVFCDVTLESFNLDPGLLAGLVTERTVGIIPVHLFGRAAAMDAVNELARRHGLWVLEDAACALGTRVGGAHAGALGDAACFSFHPRKSITTGEGGMLSTNDSELAKLARTLRDHGASRSDLERHTQRGSFRLADYDHLGFNYRMTDIQGALGAVQMERAEWILGERARQAARYGDALADLDWLRQPAVPAGEDHGWQAYVCLYAPQEPTAANAGALQERRDALMADLEDDGIATRPGTHAPVETGLYRGRYGLRSGQYPAAHLAERLTLALPLYAGMTAAEQERVVDALHRHGP